jgi:Transcriptional regulator PadR-like family
MHIVNQDLKEDWCLALGDAILACLTEGPMTGYELAKTFDASIGFYWKANHQQIYRELTERSALDQGRSFGAALRTRQHRH